MKVIVTIAVRNPEWYWSKEEMQEAGEYRKEWEALNEDKIWKHLPSDAFEIAFDVKDIKENRKAEYELKFISEDKNQTISYTIENVTFVQFIGENEKAEVVVSNSLIHQYIGARQKEYKYYIYFYLKENTPYERLGQLIWLSESHKKELESSLGMKFTEV